MNFSKSEEATKVRYMLETTLEQRLLDNTYLMHGSLLRKKEWVLSENG